MVDKLVVMEKGDLKRKTEDVGDWDTAPAGVVVSPCECCWVERT